MDFAIRLVRHSASTLALCAAAAVPAAAQQSGPPAAAARSTLSGVFTTQQAARGETIFRNTCGNCHTTSEFSGTGFQNKWAGGSIFSLVEQVRSNMPLDNPGGLSPAEYAAVLAYVLKLNSYPAGEADLPTDDAALRQIRFEKHPPKQ
jgi:S-disulfanyl-L-cysteine oxidoreductase SoxD